LEFHFGPRTTDVLSLIYSETPDGMVAVSITANANKFMKTSKASRILCGLIVGVSLCASGQQFVNANFESASTQPSSVGYPLLEWGTAAPGWSHSSGMDTSYVYYGHPHAGASQYYLLMDSTSPIYAPGTQLAGNYSLAFMSGRANAFDFNSPWVNAYISQTRTVPTTSLSLRMLAVGPFEVRIGEVVVPMYSLGGNSYGGDISGFAGLLAEVKIINTAPPFGGAPTVVDNVFFSPVAIPEPSSFALGLTAAALLRFRRHKHAA
jgi:hypothetical protein